MRPDINFDIFISYARVDTMMVVPFVDRLKNDFTVWIDREQMAGGRPVLDLCYDEDVAAGTDMNVVCTGSGDFVEVQGTAEGAPFSRNELNALLDLAVTGCTDLAAIQAAALES